MLSLDVSVPIVDDDLLEVDEIFYGNLRLPEDSTQERVAFGPARANGTITDDDREYDRSDLHILFLLLSLNFCSCYHWLHHNI